MSRRWKKCGRAAPLMGRATTGVVGPRYGWFADEDVSGLPVAQVSLKK
jgi:hypothetical protein